MLTLLLIISIIVLIFSIYKILNDERWEFGGIGAILLSTILAFGLSITIIVGSCKIRLQQPLEEKLIYYSEENTKLENNISKAISEYLEHEKDTYKEIAPDEINIYLVAYPELQSNNLVKYQLEILKENNQEIKAIKNEILTTNTWKFLIYFG